MKILKFNLFSTVYIKLLTLVATSCMLLLSSCINEVEIESTLKSEIDNREYAKIIEKNVAGLPENTQISIGIFDGSSTEYIGVLNDNKVFRRIDNEDKIFEIGSITKVFTGICLSNLIASNEATLTENLQNQFNFLLKEGGAISLLQLANHTSGLPRLPTNDNEITDLDLNDPYADYGFSHLKSYLQNHITINAPSGTEYEYSNLGMGVLGYILAKKKEISYEALLKSLIFEPLQMANSTTLIGNVDASELILGQYDNGETALNWEFTEVTSGLGSIKSSIVDMEKFVRKNFEDDSIYNLAQVSTFDRGNGFFVGLGWNIQEFNDHKLLFHGGGTGGYHSFLLMDKDDKKAVIVLSNVSGVGRDVGRMEELAVDLFEEIAF